VAGDSTYCNDKTFEDIVSGINDKFDLIETMTANVVRISYKDSTVVEEKWNYYYKKPDKIKIEYLKPHKRFLVLNGIKSIEYIPEFKKAQVIDLSKYTDDEKSAFYKKVFYRVSILGIRLGEIKKGSINIKQVKLEDFDAYFVESKDPDYQFWADAKSGVLLKHIIYDDKGEIVYSTQGADFKKFNGSFLLPQKLKIVLPDEKEDGNIIKSDMLLNNLNINEGVSDDFFDFEIPDDTQIIKH
jgi:outer membrane lipoprotein-sorting protein